MTRRDQRLLVVLAAAAAAWLLAAAALGGSGALTFAPLAVLLVPLLLGRYVGEEPLTRLAARVRVRAHRAPRRTRASAPLRAPRAILPRGGRLLAAHLAVRPPPAAPAAS